MIDRVDIRNIIYILPQSLDKLAVANSIITCVFLPITGMPKEKSRTELGQIKKAMKSSKLGQWNEIRVQE